MTHRSRAGGPPKAGYSGKGRPKSGAAAAAAKNGPRKLHHPPPSEPPTSLGAGPSRHPILDSPSDEEILEVIHEALKETLDSEDFIPLVQKVKGLLYEKRWLDVFEHPEDGWLEAYAGRWVPGRVLCFRDLMGSIPDIRDLLIPADGGGDDEKGREGEGSEDDGEGASEDDDEGEFEVEPKTNGEASVDAVASALNGACIDDAINVLSLGGGAGSEYLAIAALVAGSRKLSPTGKGKERAVSWIGADLGAWEGVLGAFENAIKSKWDPPLEMEYIRTNLLGPSSPPTEPPTAENTPPTSLPAILQTRTPRLITLLYTLTELFTQSRPLTLSLLSSLTSHCPSGTLVLVADSASDISEFPLGREGRTWPMYMILDMVLLRPPSSWEVVEKSDSRWYRLAPGVGEGWRTKLENTRYWYRLYRRL